MVSKIIFKDLIIFKSADKEVSDFLKK